MVRAKSTENLKKTARSTDDALYASIQRLASRLGGQLGGQGELFGLASSKLGESVLASAAAQGLKKHPIPTLLVGAGLAWLAWGRKDQAEDVEDEAEELIDDWRAKADEAREAASERLSALYEGLSDVGSDAAAFAREKAAITADLAQDLADAFNDGLENLTEDAANRVSDARERAYSAISSGINKAKAAVGIEDEEPEDVPGFIRRHPVASVGAALAMGAVLAAALQANRRSNGALAQSITDTASNLMSKARDIFDTETERAGETIGKATKDLRQTGGETAAVVIRELATLLDSLRSRGKDMKDDAVDYAEEAVEEVKTSTRRARSKVEDSLEDAGEALRTKARHTRKAAEKAIRPRKKAAEELLSKVRKS